MNFDLRIIPELKCSSFELVTMSGTQGETLRRVMGWDTAFGFSDDEKSHPIGSKVTRKTLM